MMRLITNTVCARQPVTSRADRPDSIAAAGRQFDYRRMRANYFSTGL